MANRRLLETARALTRLVSGLPLPPRRAPARGRFPSELSRAPLPGRELAVADIGRDLLTDLVAAALADPRRIQLLHVGHLMRASDVIEEPAEFFAEVAGDLVDHVLAKGPTPEEAMDRLLGADLVRDRMLSAEERAMRLGKALMTAVAELGAHGTDAALLRDRHWFDALTAFARDYVMRSGYEHGSRFELRQMVLMEALRSEGVLELRHQLRLPTLDGTQLRSGPDTVLYYGGLAYDVQFKAFRNIESLFSGSLTYRREGDLIRKVAGPAIPKQIVTDVMRRRHWGRRVPGFGVEEPGDARRPADLTGWVRSATKSVFVVDDAHMLNGAMALLSDARRRTRRSELHLETDIAASEAMIDFLIALFGPGPLRVGTEWDAAGAAIGANLVAFEEAINSYLRRSDVVAVVGERRTVKLLAASQGVEQIPVALGIPR